jgi:hypothetical protein
METDDNIGALEYNIYGPAEPILTVFLSITMSPREVASGEAKIRANGKSVDGNVELTGQIGVAGHANFTATDKYGVELTDSDGT